MWEVSTVFENIGVVMDGVETIARERAIDDAPDARALVVDAGGIRYDHINFNYGAAREDIEQGVIVGLDLHIRAGRKSRHRRAFRRGQIYLSQPVAAALRPGGRTYLD